MEFVPVLTHYVKKCSGTTKCCIWNHYFKSYFAISRLYMTYSPTDTGFLRPINIDIWVFKEYIYFYSHKSIFLLQTTKCTGQHILQLSRLLWTNYGIVTLSQNMSLARQCDSFLSVIGYTVTDTVIFAVS